MAPVRGVAVFCGSRLGNDPRFEAAARTLGEGLARAGLRLVYGGGKVGLMGALADAALGAGGIVLGVIPEFLTRWEVDHRGLSQIVVTDTMHARKARLYEESDAIVGLPGGIGTMDELIEAITWRALGRHDKPILICDVAGSATAFVAAIDAAIGMGFSGAEVKRLFEVVDGPRAALARLAEPGILPRLSEDPAIRPA